jgi:CBS-domain-containing membrane protein
MKSYLKNFRGQGGALPPRLATSKILLAGLGAALAIGTVAWLTRQSGFPWILGSLGASCVFLFGLPEAPFSQPRNVVAGHLICSFCGLAAMKLFGPQVWALAAALGVAVMIMFATRTVHAPAGSNPVIIFLTLPGWDFLLFPTLAGAVTVVLVGVLFNNAVHPTRYPVYWIGRDAAK